ncbi:hypothetical protein EVAR_44649_1 [Eumeta japonica]|uniref:Uncharacterized protein n=1 Tax=Eumeta variegata TaxID=151549 RepID=A0A4C1XE93_EUMVA|nr:hypothetical protein EVAR_44649_1 [Eumeta japonica]
MLREEKEKWTRLITEWYPRGNKRSKGRQHKRWEDDIKQIAGAKWTRIARDRETWKSLEEAFVAGQAVTSNNPIADLTLAQHWFQTLHLAGAIICMMMSCVLAETSMNEVNAIIYNLHKFQYSVEVRCQYHISVFEDADVNLGPVLFLCQRSLGKIINYVDSFEKQFKFVQCSVQTLHLGSTIVYVLLPCLLADDSMSEVNAMASTLCKLKCRTKGHLLVHSQSSDDEQRQYAKSQVCAVLRRRVPPCA